MNWISYAQLHEDITAFAARLPADLVGVVGVPRSGVMAASLVALHLHLRLSDSDTFSKTGAFSPAGPRLGNAESPQSGKVLLLDDSVFQGTAIGKARTAVRKSAWCRGFEVISGALYVAPRAENGLDFFHCIVPMPRVFEWNWQAHVYLNNWMSDIDGVLCCDPPVFDDDGPEYEAALRDAVPRYVLRRPIHSLISCRVCRWRSVTEDWLSRHGIAAGELILHPAPTAEARRRQGGYGQWKGTHYRKSPCSLFIESSAMQAAAIAQVARKPVLCLEDKKLYQ